MSWFKMICLLAVLVPCFLALAIPGYRQEKLLLNSVDLGYLAAAFEGCPGFKTVFLAGLLHPDLRLLLQDPEVRAVLLLYVSAGPNALNIF